MSIKIAKVALSIAMIVIMVLSMVGCSAKIGTQQGTFFSEENGRFILVDSGKDFNGRNCYVYADTVTGNMFLLVYASSDLLSSNFSITVLPDNYMYDPF